RHRLTVAPEEPHRTRGAREVHGERRAPGAGPEHGERRVCCRPRAHGMPPLSLKPPLQLVVCGVWPWFAAYSASKLTGGSRNCGKPPWLTSWLTAARAYGKSTPGQTVLIARFTSSSERLRITNRPACFTSTRKMVASPYFAETVTVSTTSRTSGPSAVEPVSRSSLISAFQAP